MDLTIFNVGDDTGYELSQICEEARLVAFLQQYLKPIEQRQETFEGKIGSFKDHQAELKVNRLLIDINQSSSAIRLSRASVYLIAAGLSPFNGNKLPGTSTNGIERL